eukprot:jgi/Ulvmu1/5790/UM025_0044.1
MESDEQLEQQLSEPGLKVVELYSQWCGPCKSILPTFKRIRLDKDDEALLKFLTVCADNCELLPEALAHRGNSEPVFHLFRNGVCKEEHIVLGANTPLLSTLIMDLTRTPPDADEAEANPFYQSRQNKNGG